MHSPVHIPASPKPSVSLKQPFRSTSLEDRSRTPSPRPSPRFIPKQYYGTHELDRRSRSPSPSEEIPYPSMYRRVYLPSKNMPELARSPTLPNYGSRHLMGNGGLVFPRLCTSPTNPNYFVNESLPYESDPMIYNGRLRESKTFVKPIRQRISSPANMESLQFSPPVLRNVRHSVPLTATNNGLTYQSQQQMSPSSFGEPDSRIFNDPFEDRPPIGSSNHLPVNQSLGVNHLRSQNHRSVIRAQPGNIPLSDSEQEDWC